ncbi:MAG: hypothetical protein JWQ36_3391 [Enterovirga sp.]|jgi:hypothetical protein|nr:hypothetical protein [Enterovirga sp.]
MGDLGSYIWFIGLGAGIVILGIVMFVARGRRRQSYVGDSNHAWKQAAAETGHPEVANPNQR